MSYIFQRGETVALALAVVAGDPGDVSAVTAAIKAVPAGRRSVDAAAPIAADFDVSFQAAAGGEAARWLLTLSPVVTAALPAGRYLADARLTIGGGAAITETVAITLRNAVTS